MKLPLRSLALQHQPHLLLPALSFALSLACEKPGRSEDTTSTSGADVTDEEDLTTSAATSDSVSTWVESTEGEGDDDDVQTSEMSTYECADPDSLPEDPIVPANDPLSQLRALCRTEGGSAKVYLLKKWADDEGGVELLDEPASGWYACDSLDPFRSWGGFPHFIRTEKVDCEIEHDPLPGERGCMRDEDCGRGFMCVCAGATPRGEAPIMDRILDQVGGGSEYPISTSNYCLFSECGDGCGAFGCAIAVDACGEELGAYCHTARDECRIHDECTDRVWQHCGYDEECGYWRCMDRVICE
jgi:hypothetical protein